jgi:endogenous inhibitor of DNA gyrase (YacG/DUF329 family)
MRRLAANDKRIDPDGGTIGVASVCPICGRAQTRGYRPFCSKRCADIDLHRWLAGGYAFSDSAENNALNETDDD